MNEERFLQQYSCLIHTYCHDSELFVRLANNKTKFKDSGALLAVMLKLGRQCFMQVGEHADGRTDAADSFDDEGVYQLCEDIVQKADVFVENNTWCFKWEEQTYRLHEAVSLVGYLGVEFETGCQTTAVKGVAASIVPRPYWGVPSIDVVYAGHMPALPLRVLFFMPVIGMLRGAV